MNLLEVIAAQRKGRCVVEAQEALQSLVKEVVATGKKGRITLTLDLEPMSDETIVVRDDVSVKIPKPSKHGSTFYPAEDGSLSREDPLQRELPTIVEQAEAQ